MALQMYVDPNLAARFKFEGPASLGAGIGGGLNKLGDAWGQMQEQRKKEAQEADALRKLAEVRQYADKDTLRTIGIGSLRGLVQGKQAEEAYNLHKAQIDYTIERTAALANQRLEPSFLSEVAKYGAQPSEVPTPFSNEEFDRRTRPLDLRSILEAGGRTGYNVDLRTVDDILRAAGGGSAATLPLGATMEVPGGTLIGTGKTPHFVKGKEIVESLDPKKYPWVYDQSDEKFLAGLNNEPDAKVREQAAASRISMVRKTSEVKTPYLFGLFGGGQGLGQPAPKEQKPPAAPAQPAVGTVRTQNGHRFQLQADGIWRHLGPAN